MSVHHSSVRKKLTHFIVTVFGESWTGRLCDMKFSPNVVTKLITKPVPWSKEGNDLVLTVGDRRGPQANVTTKSPDLAPSFPNGNNENPQEHCCLFKFSNCFCDSLVVCFIWVYWSTTVLNEVWVPHRTSWSCPLFMPGIVTVLPDAPVYNLGPTVV